MHTARAIEVHASVALFCEAVSAWLNPLAKSVRSRTRCSRVSLGAAPLISHPTRFTGLRHIDPVKSWRFRPRGSLNTAFHSRRDRNESEGLALRMRGQGSPFHNEALITLRQLSCSIGILYSARETETTDSLLTQKW
eukprot:6206350-Pleurochrysis_carterae.AAC.1